MNSPFFNQQQTCPGCGNQFTVNRVKSSAPRVVRRDTDFCAIYEGVNPVLYNIFVCPHCHFAIADKEFNQPLSDFQLARLKKGLQLLRGDEPDFAGERSVQVALRSYELAIRSAQIFQAKASYFATLFLRAAWCCRLADKAQSEKVFITEAANYYQKIYENETKDIKMSEPRLLYLIGELNRRAGRIQEAVRWYTRAVSHPGIKREVEIERLARDQWIQAKSDLKNAQEGNLENTEDEPQSEEQESTQHSEPPHADSETTGVTQPVPEPNPKPQAEEESPANSNPRKLVNIYVQLYQDQNEWLKNITDSCQAGSSLDKTAILRAVLDAVNGLELPPDRLGSEEQLRDYLKHRLGAN